MDWLINLFQQLTDVRALVQTGGYLALTLVVFSETGLLIGFFLPGDSLLVTAGLFAAKGDLNVGILLVSLSLAAVIGDAVGYAIGRSAGRALYSRPNSRLFKRSHLLRATAFYEKYGAKTIVIARFMPIIRTFAPTVAGAAEMSYVRFATYNVIGGIAWIFSMILLGYFLGRQIPDLDKHIHLVIVVIVILSVLPGVYEFWKERRAGIKYD
jgi:membrane-associated protein